MYKVSNSTKTIKEILFRKWKPRVLLLLDLPNKIEENKVIYMKTCSIERKIFTSLSPFYFFINFNLVEKFKSDFITILRIIGENKIEFGMTKHIRCIYYLLNLIIFPIYFGMEVKNG